MNSRGNFLAGRPSTHFQSGEPHIRSVSDSSSATLVSSGYDYTKFDGQIIANGSYIGSPVIIGGSYTGSFETPPRHSLTGDTSESDKDSTPSPIVIRSAPDPQMMPETPTKVSSRATFEVLTAPVIPETTEPADPANLYIKNLDDTVISDAEDLKLLFVPYGPVASSFLSTYPGSGISRGYGFVAFVKPEDAAAAKTKLNGTMVGKKRVFISYAERKEDRTQRLKGLFGGDKSDIKHKMEARATDEICEGSSDDERPDAINVDENDEHDDKVIVESTTDTLFSGEFTKARGEDLVEETIVPRAEEVFGVHENDVPPIIAEQEITVTTRWRGTQLTGSQLKSWGSFPITTWANSETISVAEVVEEEDISRITAPEDSPSVSAGVACASPLVVQSPMYSPRESYHAPAVTIIQSPVTPEQQKSPVPLASGPPTDTLINGIQLNRNSNRFTRHGGQYQQFANHSPNRSSGDHGNSRYNQIQSQGYYQNNGNGNGGNRPFNRNNTTGGYGGAKSMLPVPRNSNGVVHITPAVLMAPTGPRLPYFTNGTQQPLYPAYHNNEPIGQNQGRKNTRKSSGRGRPRDNGPSTHQTRAQNTQMNGGMVEMTAAY